MKKTLLFMMAVILLGCDKINPTNEPQPFEQAYKFQEDHILLKCTANIEYTTSGITDIQSSIRVEFDPSLDIKLNGQKIYLRDSHFTEVYIALGATNNITIYPTKPGKFTFKIKISGKPELVIPIVVNQRGYVIENLIEDTELQATYKYPTKFRIVDKADSTDDYTKRKYEISAWVKNQGKSTIFVGETKVKCDTTADFITTFAKDQSFEFEGEFTPWGAGEYEVIYRVTDNDGVTMDCPVKYNVKSTQVNFNVLNNSGKMNITEKGIKLDLALTPPNGTQSAYYIALEGFYKDELYQLDEQGNKIAGGVKRQIASYKQYNGEVVNSTIYLQTDKVMSDQRYSGKIVLYSNGERWEVPYYQTYPTLEPKITYTTNELVAFGDNNMVYLTYEFDKKTKPNKDSKLKMKLWDISGKVSLPNGTVVETDKMIDVTEFFSENNNPLQRTIPLKVYSKNTTEGSGFGFEAMIYDEFGATGRAYIIVETKLDNLKVEAKGEFTSTFPNAIDIKFIAKFETTGQNDAKLKNMKVNFFPSYKQKGYFIINGVEIKQQNVEVEINNTGGVIDAKYIPTEAGTFASELRFTTADGRTNRLTIVTTHN